MLQSEQCCICKQNSHAARYLILTLSGMTGFEPHKVECTALDAAALQTRLTWGSVLWCSMHTIYHIVMHDKMQNVASSMHVPVHSCSSEAHVATSVHHHSHKYAIIATNLTRPSIIMVKTQLQIS